MSGGDAVPPRDDVIEGAESETTRSEPSESGSWSLPESFRKLSLGLTQAVGSAKSSSAVDADSTEWIGSKQLARSHSSNMLNDESCGVAGEHPEEPHGGGASPSDAEALTPTGSMTCVTNHSHAFTPLQGDSNCSAAASAVPALSLASPSRLASKPPLPQRSGTMSPRDMPSRPSWRPTHRRSQSLQQFTPAGSFVSLTDRSTVRTQPLHASKRSVAEKTDPSPSEITSNAASDTHEIFV